MALMLDSGAFSVWNTGKVIDLDEYIEFCVAHPGIDYYVSLDVIPGKPGEINSKTPTSIDQACHRGNSNYMKMIEYLPFGKVIPVFHQGDDFIWLRKY